jgi:hypothetical protein
MHGNFVFNQAKVRNNQMKSKALPIAGVPVPPPVAVVTHPRGENRAFRPFVALARTCSAARGE